ncbi:hypothetical protein D3C76_1075320 [compost metagenome]
MNGRAAVEAGVGHGNYFITTLNTDAAQGNLDCICAVCHGHTVLDAYIGGELRFETSHFFTQNIPVTVQNLFNRTKEVQIFIHCYIGKERDHINAPWLFNPELIADVVGFLMKTFFRRMALFSTRCQEAIPQVKAIVLATRQF